ncbi:MAG: hypothetical protein ACYC5H_11630 [Methylovirgula sp.]
MYFQFLRIASIVAVALCVALPAQAQQDTPQGSGQNAPAAPPQKKPPKPYGGGSPLNVLLHTKLWETPPPVKPFVKQSRQPSRNLHFQPTIGTDAKRPKLLSKDQLKSLQNELEFAGAHNEKAAGVKDKNFADVDLNKRARPKRPKGKASKAKAKAEMPITLHMR